MKRPFEEHTRIYRRYIRALYHGYFALCRSPNHIECKHTRSVPLQPILLFVPLLAVTGERGHNEFLSATFAYVEFIVSIYSPIMHHVVPQRGRLQI